MLKKETGYGDMNFDVDPNYVTSAVASIEGDGHRVLVHKGVRFDLKWS